MFIALVLLNKIDVQLFQKKKKRIEHLSQRLSSPGQVTLAAPADKFNYFHFFTC